MGTAWANNVGFIFGKVVNGKPFNPGFDPSMCFHFHCTSISVNIVVVFFFIVIGQNGDNPSGRPMGGYDPSAQGNNINLPIEFVVSKGGAYFFSPSISVIKNKIGSPSH